MESARQQTHIGKRQRETNDRKYRTYKPEPTVLEPAVPGHDILQTVVEFHVHRRSTDSIDLTRQWMQSIGASDHSRYWGDLLCVPKSNYVYSFTTEEISADYGREKDNEKGIINFEWTRQLDKISKCKLGKGCS